MDINFSNHAKKRLNEREIKISQVKDAIYIPDYTIKKGNNVEAYKKIDNKTLKIVYASEDKFINVITLMWT